MNEPMKWIFVRAHSHKTLFKQLIDKQVIAISHRFAFKHHYYYKVLIKPKKFKKYVYIISFDYTKLGKHGKHDLHMEVRVQSARKLSDKEVLKIAATQLAEEEYSLGFIATHPETTFKVKGDEIEETDKEVEEYAEVLYWKH